MRKGEEGKGGGEEEEHLEWFYPGCRDSLTLRLKERRRFHRHLIVLKSRSLISQSAGCSRPPCGRSANLSETRPPLPPLHTSEREGIKRGGGGLPLAEGLGSIGATEGL